MAVFFFYINVPIFGRILFGQNIHENEMFDGMMEFDVPLNLILFYKNDR